MAEKEEKKAGPKILNGYAELLPSEPGKKPVQIVIGAKTYKGGYSKIIREEKGKPVVDVVPSKTRFVPEAAFKQLPESLHKYFVK